MLFRGTASHLIESIQIEKTQSFYSDHVSTDVYLSSSKTNGPLLLRASSSDKRTTATESLDLNGPSLK